MLRDHVPQRTPFVGLIDSNLSVMELSGFIGANWESFVDLYTPRNAG